MVGLKISWTSRFGAFETTSSDPTQASTTPSFAWSTAMGLALT